MNSNLQEKYLAILQEELVPAMGCTERLHWLMLLQKQEKY